MLLASLLRLLRLQQALEEEFEYAIQQSALNKDMPSDFLVYQLSPASSSYLSYNRYAGCGRPG